MMNWKVQINEAVLAYSVPVFVSGVAEECTEISVSGQQTETSSMDLLM
jgi:hypothetical protein